MLRLLPTLGLFLISLTVQSQKAVVKSIRIEGNQTTKERVILRELPVSVGDTIDMADTASLSETITKNLNNTSIFNFVDPVIDYSDGESTILVRVDERWYVWPGIVFSLAETNFNSWWQNKDFERINYGFYVQHQNFRGRMEKLTINFQNGWKRRVSVDYQVPGLNKTRTLGGAIKVYYANNRELNYASLDNRRQFFKQDRFIQEEFGFATSLYYRPKFFNRHRFSAGISTAIIDGVVNTVTTDYLPNDLLRSQYIYLSYGFRREKRDNRYYPLRGYVIDGTIDQNGVGLLRQNDIVMTKSLVTANFHHHLGGRWYAAHGYKGKITPFGRPSYFYQRGLGYGSAFIRGYELNVIDGQHYVLGKSNIKFELIKKRTTDLKLNTFTRFDKFHYSVFLNAFADAGFVVDNLNSDTNPLANTLQYGYGLGLDLVTYYDIVVRFEGSINRQGIPAFYIHFKNPI